MRCPNNDLQLPYLKGPGVAVGVAEGDQGAPKLNVDVAGPHTVLDEFSPRGLDMGNDA